MLSNINMAAEWTGADDDSAAVVQLRGCLLYLANLRKKNPVCWLFQLKGI